MLASDRSEVTLGIGGGELYIAISWSRLVDNMLPTQDSKELSLILCFKSCLLRLLLVVC